MRILPLLVILLMNLISAKAAEDCKGSRSIGQLESARKGEEDLILVEVFGWYASRRESDSLKEQTTYAVSLVDPHGSRKDLSVPIEAFGKLVDKFKHSKKVKFKNGPIKMSSKDFNRIRLWGVCWQTESRVSLRARNSCGSECGSSEEFTLEKKEKVWRVLSVKNKGLS